MNNYGATAKEIISVLRDGRRYSLPVLHTYLTEFVTHDELINIVVALSGNNLLYIDGKGYIAKDQTTLRSGKMAKAKPAAVFTDEPKESEASVSEEEIENLIIRAATAERNASIFIALAKEVLGVMSDAESGKAQDFPQLFRLKMGKLKKRIEESLKDV